MDYILESKKVGIAATSSADIDALLTLENDLDNKRFIFPYSRERHIEAINRDDEKHLSVWEKESCTLVGFILLAGLTNPNCSLEFRRIVIRDKGKGMGRDCLRLIKHYCFDVLQFHRLWLDVFEDNLRALTLYKSEGFRVDGKLREAVKQDQEYRTLLLLSILEREYRSMGEG